MFGYRERLNLESYIISLLLDGEFLESQKQQFRNWIKQAEAKDASELSNLAHSAIGRSAEFLAQKNSLLYAHALVWDWKKNNP